MGTLTKETVQMLKFNQKNALLFEILFRLIAAPLYLLLLNQGLRWSLRMAGYSYLTASNITAFLVKPCTILMVIGVILIGVLFLVFETGGLLTLFSAAAYHRKLDVGEIFWGGFVKTADEMRKKNWKLFLLVLADYILMNIYLIYRVMSHVKPVNFILSEIVSLPWGRVYIAAAILILILAVVPGLYVFHTCMIEQKNFRDGYERSKNLLKGHRIFTVFLLAGYAAAALALLTLIYLFCVGVMAAGMMLFGDKSLALAILPAAGDRVEMILIFFAGMMMTLINFAALSVQYYQYSNRLKSEPGWDFNYPPKRSLKGRILAGGISALAAVSLCFLFYVGYHGSALAGEILNPISITAHRGSSKAAPENTMAAIEAAVKDMADYVEIDVQETADGVVVLGHDSSLKRVAGVSRKISSYTYEDLKQLDVGAWFSKDYKGEAIPSLDEVLDYCEGRMNINIEIKNLGVGSALPDKVTELILDHQMKERCVVTSTSLLYLKRVKELDPDIRTGYIVSAAYGDYYSSEYIDFISIRSSFVTEKLVEAAHERGKAIHAWTVNTKSELERMKMLQVDNIITDYPVLAREIVYREKATETILEYLSVLLK